MTTSAKSSLKSQLSKLPNLQKLQLSMTMKVKIDHNNKREKNSPYETKIERAMPDGERERERVIALPRQQSRFRLVSYLFPDCGT